MILKMKKMLIITNEDKDRDNKLTNQLIGILDKLKIEYKKVIRINSLSENKDLFESNITDDVEAIVVLGGDGTILCAARSYAAYGVPIMGINLGNLGFLSSIECSDMEEAILALSKGELGYEERMMLKCEIKNKEKSKHIFYALNDIGVTRSQFSKIISLKVNVNGNMLDKFRADGIIISTPTGSTAYSLSAGGPIVDPNIELLMATPICAHSLHSRSFIIKPEDEISINLLDNKYREPVMLTVDGQHGINLLEDDVVYVTKAEFKIKIIKHCNKDFYNILRRKFYTQYREE
jgi:NAD+ kinase